MPPRRRKKLKVTVRRSHVAYRWRSTRETFLRWGQRMVFVGSAVGMAWGVQEGWRRAGLLTITAVEVRGPVPAVWEKAPPLKVGQPLFSFSSGRVERRLLERYPHLASVRVRRTWTRGVAVDLLARRPVAKIPGQGGWSALDEGGVIFPVEGDLPGVPILLLPDGGGRAEGAGKFLAALDSTGETWTDGLYKLKISPDGEATLFVAGEAWVHWGDLEGDGDRVAAKARRLSRVLSSPEAAGGIFYAHFVDDRRVVIKPRVAVAKEKESHG